MIKSPPESNVISLNPVLSLAIFPNAHMIYSAISICFVRDKRLIKCLIVLYYTSICVYMDVPEAMLLRAQHASY